MNDPLLMGFVLSCNNIKIENCIKKTLVNLIERQIDLDDRVYIYRPDDFTVPKRATWSISHLLMHPLSRINLAEALERTVYALKMENLDEYRRIIFIVTDRIEDRCLHAVRMSETMQANITFVFCDFGKEDHKKLNMWPATMYWKFGDDADFETEIVSFIKSLENINGKSNETNKTDGDVFTNQE